MSLGHALNGDYSRRRVIVTFLHARFKNPWDLYRLQGVESCLSAEQKYIFVFELRNLGFCFV